LDTPSYNARQEGTGIKKTHCCFTLPNTVHAKVTSVICFSFPGNFYLSMLLQLWNILHGARSSPYCWRWRRAVVRWRRLWL